jgi:hypothetical protein
MVVLVVRGLINFFLLFLKEMALLKFFGKKVFKLFLLLINDFKVYMLTLRLPQFILDFCFSNELGADYFFLQRLDALQKLSSFL